MSRRNKNRPQGAQNTSGVQQAVNVADAFSNPLFHLGYGSQSPLEATEYPFTRMTDNYALLNSLYRGNWVVQNVIGLMVDDMLREWYTVKGVSPDALTALDKLERRVGLRECLNEGLRWGRLYGGAAGLILIKGQDDLSQPLDLDMVYPGSFQGLYILDRWQGITPNIGLIIERGKEVPTSYSINDGNGHTVANVHASRVIRFTGRDLPRIERQTEMYWGESELEALYNEVVAHDNVSANMAALTFQANVNTMEVKGMEQLLSMSSPAVQRRFWQVMQAQATLRSNFGMQLVEQGNKLTNTQYSFAGLRDVYESMCQNLCGASHYPMTKLFGRSPGGLNATGESDSRNYYEYVDSQREAKLRPALEKLLPIMAMSAWGVVPDDMSIEFPPLWTPTAKENAEIGKIKAESAIAAFQANVLPLDTTLQELKAIGDETGLFASITDDQIAAGAGKTAADVQMLRDPLLGYGLEEPQAVQAADAAPVLDYSPNQPRDRYGRWIPYGSAGASGGGSGYSGGHREESGYDLTDDEKAALIQKDTGMSEEEAQEVVSAINDYTLEGYADIRSAQANGDRGQYLDEAEAIEKYIDAAPKFGEGDLYRGMSVPDDFASNIRVGDVIDNGGALSSWSSNENVADNFAVPEAWGGKGAVMVIEGGTQRGASIKHLSANGRDEDEVLIPASARYEVTDIFDGDTIYVYLKEVS